MAKAYLGDNEVAGCYVGDTKVDASFLADTAVCETALVPFFYAEFEVNTAGAELAFTDVNATGTGFEYTTGNSWITTTDNPWTLPNNGTYFE